MPGKPRRSPGSIPTASGILQVQEDCGRKAGINSCTPQWTGAHANLAMVAGSDDLLDHLLKRDNRVEMVVVKSDTPIGGMEGYFCCRQIDMSLLGGATYTVHGVRGFDRTVWICPVTLFVLGEYPKFVYIRQTN